MAKAYRVLGRDQQFLLPPDMREWLPADHLAWFVLDIVEALDTAVFHARRRVGGVGAAGYDPDMLLALLIYGYCQGVRSSRQIEARCVTDVAFRVLCAQDGPDHATIARFRAENQDAFEALFAQVLLVAARTGLARLGTVAIDGTKIAASASLDANRGREWLERQVSQIVAEAGELEAAQDAASGDTGPGDRLAGQLADRTGRAGRLREAAREVTAQLQRRDQAGQQRKEAALARRRRSEAGEPIVGRIPDGPHRLAEARAHLAREIAAHQAKLDRNAAIIAAGKRPMGRPPVPMEDSSRVQRARRVVQAAVAASQAPAPTARAAGRNQLPAVVANTTGPQSRIMPTRRGFLQGFNAQLAVSSDQIIIAASLTQSTSDLACLVPMMQAAQHAAAVLHAATGSSHHHIGTVLADAGYASDANLAAAGPDRLIALGKGRDQARAAARQPAQGLPRCTPPRARPWPTGCAPRTAAPSTNGGEQPSNPPSATSRRSSTGSPAGARPPPQANSTSQQPPSTSSRSTGQPPPDPARPPGHAATSTARPGAAAASLTPIPRQAHDIEIRTVICSTNAIESLNARYRRAVKARGHFPTEQAALKCLYLVTRSLDPTGTGQTRWTMRWKPALNAFAITFSDRFPAAETY